MSVPDKALSARNEAWLHLRQFTPARIGLARTGAHLSTREQLAFQLAHAQARDAVNAVFDPEVIAGNLEARGYPTVCLQSAAPDRSTYITRPDLGRQLAPSSSERLVARRNGCDVAFVIADGLSALAICRHALPLLDAVMAMLKGWNIGPVSIVEHGRVAIGDEIGASLAAQLVVLFIGERPGLSSPDSLGVYVTWDPKPGRTDAERNCISNIRAEGLSYSDAAGKLAYLMREARRRQLSGVLLKDEMIGAPGALLAPSDR